MSEFRVEVKESEISELASQLESELGGWIFHRKVDFNQKTPWIYVERGNPETIKEYLNEK